MKSCWKSIFAIALAICLHHGSVSAADLREADALFDKGAFQAALEIYEDLYDKAEDAEIKEKAFFRMCASLSHLRRDGDATAELLSTEVPEEMPHRARFLILKASVLNRFLVGYGVILRTDVLDEASKEVYQLTAEEIRDERSSTYAELWRLKDALRQITLRRESYFIDIENVDLGMYPTLFDYVVRLWTDFLLRSYPAGPDDDAQLPEAGPILEEDFVHEIDPEDPPGLRAAAIMEAAGNPEGAGRREAGERWRIRRLLLPRKHGGLFDLRTLAGDPAVYESEDYIACKNITRNILLKWMEGLSTKESRGEAGYEAARILVEDNKLAEAVSLCKHIERKFRVTHASRHAKSLRSSIEKPSIRLDARTVMPPGDGALTLVTKNQREVHFRAYAIEPQKFQDELKYHVLQEYGKSAYDFYRWSRLFSWDWQRRQWGHEWLKTYMEEASPRIEWVTSVKDRGDYESVTTDVEAPPFKPGIYLIVACGDDDFRVGRSLIFTCFLNVTDLVLLGTGGFTTRTLDAYYAYLEDDGPNEIRDEGFRFYALHAGSGRPAGEVKIDVAHHADREEKGLSVVTDVYGMAPMDLTVRVRPHSQNPFLFDPLARLGDSYAYWSNDIGIGYSPPTPLVLYIETDRPIYQPGHEVSAKVIVVRRSAYAFKAQGAGRKVIVSATDPNGKEFFSQEVETGEFGSGSVTFTIPRGRLLGKYALHAKCNDGYRDILEHATISVEEYKRPEFEIELEPAAEPWKYHEQVEISGSASYYFGGPVPGAPVTYKIKRQAYIPYYFRSWFYPGSQAGGDEIASGEITTDDEGKFTITFTPTPRSFQSSSYIPDISNFIVEVEGRDSGGRTIVGQRSYKAGSNAVYLVIKPEKGFFSQQESPAFEISRLTMNNMPAAGKSTYDIYTVVDTASGAPRPRQEGDYPYWIPPLDVQLKDAPSGDLVAYGTASHGEDGKASIEVADLPAGVYRIIVTSRDDWGTEAKAARIFVVVDETGVTVPGDAYSITLAEHDEYALGDVASFLVGAGRGSGIYHVEIWAGEHLVWHDLMEGDRPARVINVAVNQVMKGGFTVRWFGARDLEVHFGQTNVAVPWPEKKLEVELEPFDEELLPGKSYTWGVRLTDAADRPVRGEVLALMYDRSLEYYARRNGRWLDGLYALRTSRAAAVHSVFTPRVHTVPIVQGPLATLLMAFRQPPAEPRLPGLRGALRGKGRGLVLRGGRSGLTFGYTESLDETVAMEVPALAVEGEFGSIESDLAIRFPGTAGEEAAARIEARQDFAETAFFLPHLLTAARDGRARFEFKAPEQLTSWRIKLLALTQDVKEGSLTEEVRTKKDLMVRADLPRFFREKDRGTITALVHNETERNMKGELYIDVMEDGVKINRKLNLSDPRQHFDIAPHGVASFDWLVDIPEGISTYTVRVAAIAGRLSDAEERDLPILPSRQRLIESDFVALSGNDTEQLEIRLKDDPTRINESMVLQIDPQLTLSILNSIPFLIEYPYSCVEQILNRFVPLSIVNQIYKEYPAIREAVGKIPDRTTVTPPWEEDDPRRLITLMETPWVWQSEGRPTTWPIIDLLDPAIVEAHRQTNLSRLQGAQHRDGGFPWWPGGRPDAYMTLYVLAGLAEARRFGVEVPEDMIRNALRYVYAEIPRRLKPEQRDLALVSLAAYVVTSYAPGEFPEARPLHEATRSWVVFLERNVHEMTPLPKAYLAYTYLRLGERRRAEEVLDLAMDGFREDPIAGVYWTPEKYSWVWYSDTVEKHAFLLRTLQELRPDDERIPGMVQWLLFSRKGTVWKSTKASVAAVYALLDYLNQLGALDADETFTAAWGRDTYSVTVKAEDWLDEPLRWEARAAGITPDKTTATIGKQGPGLAFASLTWTYSTDQIPEASQPGMLELSRRFYRRIKEGEAYHLKPIESGDKVAVGDQIEVHLKINTRSQFEYMHLKDPKAAGFEAETLLSGWKYDPLWYYEEPRHSLTNFFVSWLPHGEYIVRYRLRPTKPGTYRIGAATLQSMYAPEMTAHSAGFIVRVE